MKQFKTDYTIIRCEILIRNVAMKLIDRSQWFEITPLPDGEYRVDVKMENAAMLHRIIAYAKQTPD